MSENIVYTARPARYVVAIATQPSFFNDTVEYMWLESFADLTDARDAADNRARQHLEDVVVVIDTLGSDDGE